MKKVLVLLGIFSMVQMASFASMTSSEVSSINSFKTQGYSENALKVLDTAYGQVQGEKYVSNFVPKKHNKLGGAYTRLKTYFDPIQEDDKFGKHQIEFTNTWLGDETHYTSTTRTTGGVENL